MALVSYEEKINHMRNYYMKKIKKILESSKNKKETLEIILSTLVTTYLENKRTPNFRKIIENKNIHIDDFDNIEIEIGNIDDENIRIFMNEQLLEEKILKYLIYDLKNELKEEQIDEYDDEYDDEITEDINAVIDNIQDENEKKQIKDIINYYQSQYNAPIEFIAHGGSVEVFAIGDKIIKFGNKRRTNNIPRTLKYDNITTYHEGETEVFMYVEDRIRNISKSDEDVKEMYFFLRDNGFIWTDPKPDNIAIKDNQPILIDDIDVYDEKIYIKENTKSVLEFLTHRNYSGNPQKLAELEIMWLERTQPDFDIEKIDSYFSHQDNSTKRVITDLKDNYKAKKRKYEVSEDTVYLKDFFEELEQTIDLEKILNEIKQNNLDDKAIYNLLTRYNVPTEGNSKLIEKIPDIIEHLRQSVGERKITISQQSKSDALYLTNGIIRNNSLKLYIPYDKEHIAEASKKNI